MTEKQLVVIFGASSEIIRAIDWLQLTQFEVILVSRKISRGSKVQSVNFESYTVDELGKLHEEISARKKIIFIFANGASDRVAFYKLTESEITSLVDVNLVLPMKFTAYLLNKYITKHLVFIYCSSSRAIAADRGIVTYSTSKSALVSFAKCMALEYGKFQKRFYVLSLGLFKAGLNKEVTEPARAKIFARSANPKYVSVNELIRAIDFASSSCASNGSVLKIDNGYF